MGQPTFSKAVIRTGNCGKWNECMTAIRSDISKQAIEPHDLAAISVAENRDCLKH
jgi:hypothetical protein